MAHIRSRKHVAEQLPRLNSSTAGVMAAAVLALPGAAFAQTAAAPAARSASSPSTLPAVKVQGAVDTYKADTVSSPKFTQPIVDTPQTITVIKKEVLREQGATTLSDALRNTPGVTMLMGENGNTATGDSIFMRGFDTQGSIFVDGIRDLGTVSRDTFNIEQIEIVKGPAGADNGRGSPTGYVNLSTKVPTLDDFSLAGLAYGSGDRKRATVDVNRALPIFGDSSALRLNLMAEHSGAVERDYVNNKSWGFAPSLALGLNTPTRTYLYYLHVDQNKRPDGGIPAIGLPGFYSALLDAAGVVPARVNRSNYYGSPDDFDDTAADMFTLRFEHDFGQGMTLRNTSRYGRTKQQFVLTGVNVVTIANPLDPATWTVSRSRQGKDQSNEILTNQTNVTAEVNTGPVKHSLSGGVEFIYEKQSNLTFTPAGTQVAANLYNPNVNDPFVGVVPSGGYASGSTKTAAAYLFDTLKLNEQWLVNGGLRVEKYKTAFDSITLATAAANPTLPVGTLIPADLGKVDTLLTWKTGAVYKPAANGSVYVAYATSQKPPGSDNFTLSATANNINSPNLDPQEAENVEVGTKWDLLNGKLAVTAALFRTTNKNDAIDPPDPVTGAISQYGEKRVQGLELGAVGQITAGWQISAGLAVMETTVTQAATASPTQQGAGINWSPKVTFTAWTTYKLPLGLTVGGGARYVDTQARQINNAVAVTTNVPQVPSYTVFDAMLAYEVSKNLSIQLNVYNLADKFYVASLNNAGTRYTIGAPRSALLTANLSF